ncbi:MAG: hypothetical protein ACKVSF_12980 [Alphaproteobacteria bacterium]
MGGAIAPFLFDDIAALPDWRERLAWPISLGRLRASAEAMCSETIAAASELTDALERQVFVVACGRFVNAAMSLVEAGLVAQVEATHGILPLGGPPEMAYLRGHAGAPHALEDRRRGMGVLDVTPADWPLLRAFARARSWSSPIALPRAVMWPDAVAVSHNSLLITRARRLRPSLGYRPAANFVAAARRDTTAACPENLAELARRMAPRLIARFPELNEPFRARVTAAFVARLEPVLRRIGADILALRAVRRLPKALWRGTGGSYAGRVLSAEVLRRGGYVLGFDHGGDTGISQLPQLTAMIELMVASEFCVGTDTQRRLLEDSGFPAIARPVHAARIIADRGEELFRRASIDGRARSGARRRVVYVGHPFRGLRQFAIVGTPDAVYWDLQSRVAKALAGMAIDLVCKPHPEGALVGRRNPIEDFAPTSYRRFEEHLADTDVFVFDAPTSTTFAEALCTNRPVVLIERGHYPFNPRIEGEMRARVRMVPSRVDERGRIWPDAAALEDAVMAGAATADPGYFRRLLAGKS